MKISKKIEAILRFFYKDWDLNLKYNVILNLKLISGWNDSLFFFSRRCALIQMGEFIKDDDNFDYT